MIKELLSFPWIRDPGDYAVVTVAQHYDTMPASAVFHTEKSLLLLLIIGIAGYIAYRKIFLK